MDEKRGEPRIEKETSDLHQRMGLIIKDCTTQRIDLRYYTRGTSKADMIVHKQRAFIRSEIREDSRDKRERGGHCLTGRGETRQDKTVDHFGTK